MQWTSPRENRSDSSGLLPYFATPYKLLPMKSKNPVHISLNVYYLITCFCNDSNLIQTLSKKK